MKCDDFEGLSSSYDQPLRVRIRSCWLNHYCQTCFKIEIAYEGGRSSRYYVLSLRAVKKEFEDLKAAG